MPKILFAAEPALWPKYEGHLFHWLSEAGIAAELAPDLGPPEEIDYIVYSPGSDVQDFTPYTRLKAVLNLWAGVENVTGNETLKVPLARMVDGGLTEGMVEWVVGHVLRHHLDIDHVLAHQDGRWVPKVPPLARHRPVTVLGLGALGAACAQALAALNFPVTGWSRSAREVAGVTCLSDPGGLEQALARAEILVLLLPLTPGTESLLNAAHLDQLHPGAILLNPGRGALIDDDALLAALDSGQIAHATLDTFRTEPLPPEHPFWTHPRVTVTPHIASATRAETAAQVVVENIRRGEAGLPFLHLVDRDRGY
ncbi:glyoxylate/hydroxypyruvate reductase A [Tropicimonas sp. IMCC6043]|uniref:2-hydroxyacid dehydrogenase n=1 Tax=Tropicimonas sp. IMCC6043 TaxID=2510645 RepID=UPI00101D96F6|nr:glyoxylate/hydroxypyruvate reductase A [Tropicimonas sp. IMCC6043]RYH08894.1 glyoxylate/hydroxypyruvate reductase A [Tropicimonas sp. IMCC6043]